MPTMFCFIASFITFYEGCPIPYIEPFVVPAPTYEVARSYALESAQEIVRNLEKIGVTAYFHLDYLPQ